MTPSEIRKLVQNHFEEIFNKGNLNFADEVYAPTALIHDPNHPDLPSGPEAIKQLCRITREGFPDVHYDVQSIIVEGDQTATRWTVTGTHKGVFMGIAPTGKLGSVTGLSMSRIENGLIAEVWLSWDVRGFLRQAGVEIPVKVATEAFV